MKIALIGNMNNNHFSLMRYLVDIGLDAHLLLYKNEQSLFLPTNDTWYIDKWSDRIHQTKLDSYGKALLYFSKSELAKNLLGYDFYIGNGFAPAYLHAINKTLDIFLPYGLYVEGLTWKKFNNPFKNILYKVLKNKQKKALKKSTTIACAISDVTRKILNDCGCNTLPYGIPMVYIEKDVDLVPATLNKVIDKIISYDLVVHSHVSHIWKNRPEWWTGNNKANDTLILGFAKFIKSTHINSILLLHNYGKDVNSSKELINKLNISKNVIWLDKLSRKEIMILLDYIDVGCGELGGHIWGGTGWEYMAKGVPFFQYVNITSEDYKTLTGTPLPKFINVKTPDAICDVLLDYNENTNIYDSIGKDLKIWFDEFGGSGLAYRYKELVLALQ